MKIDPYVLNAVSEICKTSDLPPGELLDELPKVIAQLQADSPAKRRFLTHIQQHHRPKVRFYWDAEQQAVCLRGIGLSPVSEARTSRTRLFLSGGVSHLVEPPNR